MPVRIPSRALDLSGGRLGVLNAFRAIRLRVADRDRNVTLVNITSITEVQEPLG